MVEYHQNKALRLMDRGGNAHGETILSKYPTISNCWFNKKQWKVVRVLSFIYKTSTNKEWKNILIMNEESNGYLAYPLY